MMYLTYELYHIRSRHSHLQAKIQTKINLCDWMRRYILNTSFSFNLMKLLCQNVKKMSKEYCAENWTESMEMTYILIIKQSQMLIHKAYYHLYMY